MTFSAAEGEGYRVRITDTDGAELGSEVPFAPFIEDDEYEELRWYLEEFMDLPDGGAVTRARRLEAKLDEWGRRMYDALFGVDANAALLRELLASPEPRELTIATGDAVLLRLPWELMADAAGALAQRVSVRRQLAEPGEQDTTPAAALPLRLLYIVSRPDDTGFIDPRLTSQAMLAALDPLGANVRADFCRPPTLARMEELLHDARREGAPYHLVHFDGHGTFLPEAQIGALCFEKSEEAGGRTETDLVPADRLGTLLADHEIPLVVLEACRSGTVRTLVFRSVAPRLIQAGVGSVLSMGHAVHVEAARILLDRFYRELVKGTTIGHAVAVARKSLVSTNERWIEHGPGGRRIVLHDWFLPHLYQRGHDHPMLPAATADHGDAVREFDVFLSHNHDDSGRVEVLARTLSESHALRPWLDQWECRPGPLEPQCEQGIRDSRFTVVVGSQKALDSNWVRWEVDKHQELHRTVDRLLPIKLEPLELPDDLQGLLWVDFTDPAADAESAARLARLIRSTDAEDARRKRGFRAPAGRGEAGAFPPPPQFGFRGRARELHRLQRRLRRTRGVVLHAMGGMGKTALAGEAARWWTRSGLFRDGACFFSFERPQSAESIVRELGCYLEGPNFEQRPANEQRRRVVEDFQRHAVLLVWDNFESCLPQFAAPGDDGEGAAADAASPYTEDVRRGLSELFHDLTAGDGLGRILVTCRPGKTFLDKNAGHFELEGLARVDSLWLLAEILERDGLSLSDPRFERSELDPLLDDLADHPLSLELVGPHLRTLTPAAIRADFGVSLARFRQEAGEERNTSLLASLEFSKKHLSEKAREALPWLGLFQGGVFEQKLLELSEIEPSDWEPLRAELAAIALVRVEDEIQINERPYLRFHPTLAAAAWDPEFAARKEVRERFVAAYLVLMKALEKALEGAQSRTALRLLQREEPNYRRAVRWAAADGFLREAAALGYTLSRFLERSGRLRERNAWVAWLGEEVAKGGFSAEAAAYESEQAWARFTQGDPQGAVSQLEAVLQRLRRTTEFDPTFQLATATLTLGRVLYSAGASPQAIPVLRDAVSRWEALVEKAGGSSWREIVDAGDVGKASTELGNLAATLGDLANALLNTGDHEGALLEAETGVQIQTARGVVRDVAAGQGRCASILKAAGRYAEADARYERALAAAHEAGDHELVGITLQHQGSLAADLNNLDRATALYRQALASFLQAGDDEGAMQTYNLLGVAERKVGRLAEARGWYERSRELALALKDQDGLGQAAQNLGIVSQNEGELAREAGDEDVARRRFEAALRSVEESRKAWKSSGNQPYEAGSESQLARIHLLLGDLDAAERHAHAAREIRESLGFLDAMRDHHTLAEIAEARGDHAAAVEWKRKRDTLRAEAERRARGSGEAAAAVIPEQTMKALGALGLACLRTGFDDSQSNTLGLAEEQALAQIDGLPDPFPVFGAHLRALAGGQRPPIPDGLPEALHELLKRLHGALS